MRKHSKYRPYRVDPTAWQRALSMQHEMDDDQLLDLGLAIHNSIERMRLGMGVELDFHTIAALVNVSLVLCERGVGPEGMGCVQAAQDALVEILERQRRTGKWGFSGPEMQAINDCAHLHEQQIAIVPRRECRDAMLEVRRRVDRGEVLNAA
ncbi:MAG: hypothetical protein ROZ09_15050 [Thiobacillus sp.]|jgi:hypothetical protein|uniref:hypothetical protein n=1 Tax=Thiobacillus sp. TaxID=924 RepID=UPI002893C775|nr:hypothetical protein [Thiobacillus sp.]MDT3708138.1 hypothetical protein [Thiobacillus sp.]